MVNTARMLALAWICLGLVLIGCQRQGGDVGPGDPARADEGTARVPRQLRPSDFAGEARATPVGAIPPSDEAPGGGAPPAAVPGEIEGDEQDELFDDGPAPATGDTVATSEEVAAVERLAAQAPRPQIKATAPGVPEPSATPEEPPTGEAYTMDAMVGQVNGRAIYAAAVFEPIAEQLTALGRTLEGPLFQRRAVELISARLDQMITDALILSEAMRDLSEGERYGLRAMTQRKREDLLRYWGQGSLALTEDRLRQETGKSLDETLEAYRQQQLVRRYLMQKLLPLINVTRRDVEQHYRENLAVYQPPIKRTVRLIRVDDAAEAATVADALATGTPFAEVAKQRPNRYRPEEGGLWPDPIVGDEGLGGALGQALRDMSAGQHKGPIAFNNAQWWLFVETEERGQSRSLRQVQLDIEKELRQSRFRYLSQRYRQRLYDEGSFNEMEKMIAALLDVAVSRYDAAPR